MERDVAYNIYEKLAEKYGMSLEKAKETCQSMVHAAQDIGLDYQFDSLILTNTFDAHRLAMFAKKLGLMQEMTGRILRGVLHRIKAYWRSYNIDRVSGRSRIESGSCGRYAWKHCYE